MKKARVPGSDSFLDPASHDPELMYQVQEENGEIKTYFLDHPDGSRRFRRAYQHHKPQYTKPTHKGRSWIKRRKHGLE